MYLMYVIIFTNKWPANSIAEPQSKYEIYHWLKNQDPHKLKKYFFKPSISNWA